MRPRHRTRKYVSIDLTECKINRLIGEDGVARFVVSYPTKWQVEPGMRGTAEVEFYHITEWEEAELVAAKP